MHLPLAFCLRVCTQVVLFISVRSLPIPSVSLEDSALVRPVKGLRNFYMVVFRHGYQVRYRAWFGNRDAAGGWWGAGAG